MNLYLPRCAVARPALETSSTATCAVVVNLCVDMRAGMCADMRMGECRTSSTATADDAARSEWRVDADDMVHT